MRAAVVAGVLCRKSRHRRVAVAEQVRSATAFIAHPGHQRLDALVEDHSVEVHWSVPFPADLSAAHAYRRTLLPDR